MAILESVLSSSENNVYSNCLGLFVCVDINVSNFFLIAVIINYVFLSESYKQFRTGLMIANNEGSEGLYGLKFYCFVCCVLCVFFERRDNQHYKRNGPINVSLLESDA